MTKTKIEWADYTWNPVWGCLNNCRYCYAKKIASRFGKDFSPHWVESNWLKPFPKDTKRVFVNSMSDVMYWEESWWLRVLGMIKLHPDIDFIFLTKGGTSAYPDWVIFPANCILGITVTSPKDLPCDIALVKMSDRGNRMLLNFEPILEPFPALLTSCLMFFDWLIIGAETGNSKGKVVPDYSWYGNMIAAAKVMEIPVFLKPSLKDMTPEHVYRQEFMGRRDV